MTTPQQQIIDKCQVLFTKAKELYNLDLSRVGIRFDLKGSSAGQACRRGGVYYMRFNRDMLNREAFDHLLNNTVPHEIAHIVCFMNPMLGSSHNSGWERVCTALGGNATRCHKEEVVYGKGKTYEYVSTTGVKHRLSEQRHNSVQRGQPLVWRKGGGTVNNLCAYSIVGFQGRTLAEPIVKKPANHLAVIETVLRTSPALSPTPTFTIGAPEVKPVPKPATFAAGASKAAIARGIMLSGYKAGKLYEDIIAAIMHATGHDRQLARATYKANTARVGIPAV